MQLQGERIIPASIDTTWAALNDPEVLKACIAGCESLERTGDDAYAAVVAVKVGPVGARFKGNLKLTDVQAPNSYTIHFDGQGGVAGFGKGSADVALTAGDADRDEARLRRQGADRRQAGAGRLAAHQCRRRQDRGRLLQGLRGSSAGRPRRRRRARRTARGEARRRPRQHWRRRSPRRPAGRAADDGQPRPAGAAAGPRLARGGPSGLAGDGHRDLGLGAAPARRAARAARRRPGGRLGLRRLRRGRPHPPRARRRARRPAVARHLRRDQGRGGALRPAVRRQPAAGAGAAAPGRLDRRGARAHRAP